MENYGSVSETKSKYEVFLSFRGEDTRHTFTCHLYGALVRKGIHTFMDDGELKVGDQLASVLLKAIEESRMSIVVLSENYAASSWCLDELVHIHNFIKSKRQQVWPIFYKVDPSDVRYQNGSYGEAMTKHETRFGKDSEKVQKWRSALTDIANLKGTHLTSEQGIDEFKFIDKLVKDIFNKVSSKDLSSNEYIVGRKNLVEELKSLLDLESCNIICLLGIHGAGGIGKTTLAKALYDSIYKNFQGSSFLFNVRETSKQINGLELLQQRLLSNILEDNKIKVESKEEGIRKIKDRLCLKRVLIVLDDISNIEQLNNLAGERNWFGLGSRIIITTRNKHLLDGGVEKRYEMKFLDNQESLELFCHCAFKQSYPKPNSEDMSNRAVHYCKGLPLALKVLGFHMVGRQLAEWKDALDTFEKSPHEDVQRVLRISYDNLPINQKNIFLDIACFFRGKELEYVEDVLDGCDFNPRHGIKELINKSLLTVDNNFLEMHDLIQDMGREIVKEEAWNEVGDRSRLWHHEDILQVLVDNNGSSKIQGIMLDPPQSEEVDCIETVFEKMKNLRILIIRNTKFSRETHFLPNSLRLLDWKNYPSWSFPSGFYPRKIVVFNQLKKLFQRFEHLTCMNISSCGMVTKFPDVSGIMKLRELRLDKCYNLVCVHESVGRLTNLAFLSVSQCKQLRSFLPAIHLPSLKYLSFKSCYNLAHFPEIGGTMDKPLKVKMTYTAIEELPESIEKLTGLNYLDMSYCKRLKHLPSSLFMLPNFVTLKLNGCVQLGKSFRRFQTCQNLEVLHFEIAELSEEEVHMIIQYFPNLKHLNLRANWFRSLPSNIIKSTKLTSLDLSDCYGLHEIPELPSSVQNVKATHCDTAWRTSNMLWPQVRKEVKGLQVVMPNWNWEIPEWFDYVRKGDFVKPVFKARGKFPALALALALGYEYVVREPLFDIELLIEGERMGYRSFYVPAHHALLLDIRSLLSLEEWDLGNDWKTIKLCCETNRVVKAWGVYVYKHETSVDHIQFADL